jgi:molybdate transport system substrate-binding protein
MDSAISEFKKTTPTADIKPVYGSSGNFYAQVRNGAPFDMFFSADMEYLRKLADEGFAIRETMFEHAVGRLVIWVRKDSPLDVEKRGMEALTDSSVKHVAIANPATAPYGRGAVAAMQKLAVYEKVRERLVLGENVSQALEFIDSGQAQIGIVAMSLATAPSVKPKGRYWEIPLTAYPRMDQGGIILKSSQNREAAEQFRSFILSEQGRTVFKQFGFYMPEDPK